MSDKNKTVNVIRHLAFEDLGSFAAVLQAHDYRVNYIEAADYASRPDDLLQTGVLSAELLVILGGPISVNDAAMFPFINTEITILQQRIAADSPTLGICLGAQMIASALGVGIYPGEEKEIGWYDLRLTSAGEQSAMRYLGANHCSMLHWHGETFDLPEDAVLLASSEKYRNQAFSYGNNILALQFHPEITQQDMEKWFIGHIGEIQQTAGVSVESLREETRQYARRLEMQGELFFNSWLNEVNAD
jgi:GMP synthase (glutamine-hydrolysing)